ncbi:MAG: beta-phosphoglucomutase [Desulfobulbus propionicus]|nr:MAG: beta-phosphoglucomutase [Desulfobulbus propionicus]
MLKLIVFDCDGVMFSSLEANRVYYNHLLSHFDCPPMNTEELTFVHAHDVTDSVAHIFRRHTHLDQAAINDYRFKLDYTPFLKYMQMEEDLPAFLSQVKQRYHTAISTNRTTTMDMILDTFQLRPWFDLVVTASDVPNPKPAPDALLKILGELRVQPSETLYIGDSTVDALHCSSVGVDLIAFKNRELDAKYHVGNFMDILELPPLCEN